MDNHDLKNFEFLKDKIKVGNILVDVGANEGDYTEYFREKLNNTGRIYSIELFPETYARLENRFENYKNICPLNCAVSDTDEVINYYKGSTDYTNNIIGHDMTGNKNEKAGQIQSIRLDILLKDYSKIDLIKIDVEGAEIRVLKGMKNIIYKVKYILIENHIDEEWYIIRDILLNEYNMDCLNVSTEEKVTMESNKAYQCFCTNKNNI